MARIYTNENFPLAVTTILRNLGHDVLTTQEAGRSDLGIPDEEVLSFAVSQKRILLTLNRRDFLRLHRLDSNHCGILICTENINFQELAARIQEAIEQCDNFDKQLVRVYKAN